MATAEARVAELATAIGHDMARLARDGVVASARLTRLEADLRAALGRSSAHAVSMLAALTVARTAAASTPPAAASPALRTQPVRPRGRFGLHREAGVLITGWEHVVQSIHDILSTRIGARVMMRAYGSDVPPLVDAPMTAPNILALYVAVAEALARWEPRFRLRRVSFVGDVARGSVALRLDGLYLPRGHLGDVTPAGGNRTLTLADLGPRALLAA